MARTKTKLRLHFEGVHETGKVLIIGAHGEVLDAWTPEFANKVAYCLRQAAKDATNDNGNAQ